MADSIRGFEELEVWRACRELLRFVSGQVVRRFPPEEKYELASQIKRSARSTTANIAEGYGRFHFRDNYKFCSNARGSLHETLDHLITAHEESYIDDDALKQGRQLFEKSLRVLNGYMSYLLKQANAQ